MLLVCGSSHSEETLGSILKQQQFDLISVVDLVPKPSGLADLASRINLFDYVVLVSPSCISFAKSAIMKATKPAFIVMGASSYQRLIVLNSNMVFYPKLVGGVQGIINEVLPRIAATSKKFLIVKGEANQNQILLDALLYQNAFVESIDLYDMVFNIDPNYVFGKMFDIKRYSQIIITSSKIVTWLFEKAQVFGYTKELQGLSFMTWHDNIAAKLRAYGVLNVLLIANK